MFYHTPDEAIYTLIYTGVALGAWVAQGVTGGHVNPVVCCHAFILLAQTEIIL